MGTDTERRKGSHERRGINESQVVLLLGYIGEFCASAEVDIPYATEIHYWLLRKP